MRRFSMVHLPDSTQHAKSHSGVTYTSGSNLPKEPKNANTTYMTPANSGTITTPNYPSDYPKNVDVYYVVPLLEAKTQTVRVTGSYEIEDRECKFDILVINDDGVKYCSVGYMDKSFQVTGGIWTAYFHTDDTFEHPGFMLHYSVTG
ncbi:hypothetical protein BaRGS_00033980 [Batillaria attramentaria]|uniref:CUB domain-containing protein n=1 Tax=Batillaria attramentaria TaxID=370345 RepID=A0ABD0JIN5_9CAEN